MHISPSLALQSGAPFNITTGSDLCGTTLFNGCPALQPIPTGLAVVRTAYGLLDPNPAPGKALVPRNPIWTKPVSYTHALEATSGI